MNQLLLKSVFTHILHVLYRLTWAMQIQTVLSAFQETIQFALMKPFDLISVCFVGFRYRLSGLILPSLKDWFEGTFGANLQHKSPATVSPVCFIQLCTRLLCCVIVCLIHGVCVCLPLAHSEFKCSRAAQPERALHGGSESSGCVHVT